MSEKITSVQAVLEIMGIKGETNVSLGKKIGKTSAAMWDRLNRDNLSVSTLVEMVTVMGYKVIVVPDDKPVRKGEYEVK